MRKRTKPRYRLPALFLCLGLLAGCGEQEAQPSSSGQGSESPSASQSQPAVSVQPGNWQEVLQAIPYYGDAEKCDMTAEQALAYAQLLADGIAGKVPQPEYLSGMGQSDVSYWDALRTVMGYSGEYQTDRANVILGDFAGDGRPYICVLSSEHPDCCFDIYWYDGEIVQFVYGDETYGGRLYTTFCLDESGKMFISTGGSNGAASHFTQRLGISGGRTEVLHSRDEEYDQEAGVVRVTEDGTETTYPIEEWEGGSAAQDWGELPNATFTPIPLRDMIGYLNQYAAAKGSNESVAVGERSDGAKIALAMLAALDNALSDGSGGQTAGDARLVDLDGDGTEELVTCNGSQALLHYWQEDELQIRDIGWVMGSQTEWWLCKDADTGELGIEWRVNGADGLSGGSTFVYFSHESNVSESRDSADGPASYLIDGETSGQEEFDALRAQNQRVEELVSQNGSEERVEQVRAALKAML